MSKALVALEAAIRRGETAEALRLLAEGELAVEQWVFRDTPALVHAAQYGDVAVVRRLLEMGANVNAKCGAGFTALHRSLRDTPNREVYDLLIAAGADIHARDESEETPLAYAAQGTHAPEQPLRNELVRDLLARGAHAEGEIGTKAIAGRVADAGLVKLLLERGAKPDEAGLSGAVKAGSVEAVQLLLDAGARFEETEGLSVLCECPRSGVRVAIAELLLQHGANPKYADEDNYTVLNSAITSDRLDLAQWLIAHGASIHTNPTGHRSALTPLAQATSYASPEMLGWVLEQGVDARSEDASAALSSSIQSRSLAKVQRLLRAGADPNRGLGQSTPLRLAIETRHEEILSALLEHGADPNLPADAAPLGLALEMRRAESVQLLLLNDKCDRGAAFQGSTLRELAEQSTDPRIPALFAMTKAELEAHRIVPKKLALVNYRQLLEQGSAAWEPHVRIQMKRMFGDKTDAQLRAANDGGEVELLDVVDAETQATEYQMYLYPYGDGAVFNHATDKPVARICQHSVDFDFIPEADGEELTALFHEAYTAFNGKLRQFLRF